MCSAPSTISSAENGANNIGVKGAPCALLQNLQWQFTIALRSLSIRYRMAPQRQLPECTPFSMILGTLHTLPARALVLHYRPLSRGIPMSSNVSALASERAAPARD